MITDTQQLYLFLTACRGNWRSSIYITCQETDNPGYLLSADRDSKPMLMPITQFQQLTGEQIDPTECCGQLSEEAFQCLYAQYLLWQEPYLLKMVKDKDYFVLTTNVDHCFQKAGFDKKRLFYTQGDYGLFQCSEPCCQETFDNEGVIKAMMEQQRDMRIPSSLIPHCPHCGKPMTMNLRADDTFVEDEGWHIAAGRYSDIT